MRPDDFKKLFDAEKIGRLSNAVVARIAFYLTTKGIRNEDVPLLVPYISVYLNQLPNNKKADDHKAELKKIIDESIPLVGIENLVEPVRVVHDTEKQHRRMDALARVLALNEIDTPCVAVGLVGSDVVISFNLPIKSDVDKVKQLLAYKFDVVRNFLIAGVQLSEENKLDDILALIKETKKLIISSGSHSQVLLPPERRKRANMDKFLEVALGKLLTAVVKLPESGGFKDEDRDALLFGEKVFLVPNREIENKIYATFHAEQVIVDYVGKHKKEDGRVYVGISKLCCAACRDVLTDNPSVMFRGSHGMTFPNVMDMRNMRSMEYEKRTKLIGLSHADDSDSEPEIEDFRSYKRGVNAKGELAAQMQANVNRLFNPKKNDEQFPPEEENKELPQCGMITFFK